jgi:hypothetical protein
MFLLHNTKYLGGYLGIKRLAASFWLLAVRSYSLWRNTEGGWRLATGGWRLVVIVWGEFQKVVYLP